MKALLSVVVPALNSAKTIRYTLFSIFSNKLHRRFFEVLVIDNGSTDNTLAIAREFPTQIYNCKKRGIGFARNSGIGKANGEIICFVDSDCIVEHDWLTRIFEFFEKHPEVDGVGGPVLPYPNVYNKVQKLTGEIFLEDHDFPVTQKKVKFGIFRGVLFGTNSAYRKDALISVGGYEEPGGSSPELSYRLVKNGKVLIFDPTIKVYHIFPWSLRVIFKQNFRWGVQMTEMEIKHGLFTLRGIVLSLYFLPRLFLSYFSFRDSSKKTLRFTQLVVFSLGRLRGMRITHEEHG